VTETVIEIIDSGKGFSALDEIERCFEVFGAPHSEEEGKIWANFRMGRGQMFSFGVNTWRTSKYELAVDIDNKGLNYEIRELKKPYNGCHIKIELYRRLMSYEVYNIIANLKTQLKYAPVPIYVNEERINPPLSEHKWTHETDDAYIMVDGSNTLSVYNLGIFVRTFYAGNSFGVGGTVVSKHQLQVNFARNDIQSTCEVWQRISEKMTKIAGDSFTADRQYTDAEIERIAVLLKTKQYINSSIVDAKIIQAVTGRKYSLKQLNKHIWASQKLTVAPDGDRIGDMIHRSQTAFVLAESTLRRFKADDVREFLYCWDANSNTRTYVSRLFEMVWSFKELAAGFKVEFETLETKDCSRTVQVWLSVAQIILYGMIASKPDSKFRKALCGNSPVANAWTDGHTYVAYDKKFLDKLPMTLRGVLQLAFVTLHELQHNTPDLDRHDHDQAFYENYHDGSLDSSFAAAVANAYGKLPQLLKDFGIGKAKASAIEKLVAVTEVAAVE
jgi:hypothetical protein